MKLKHLLLVVIFYATPLFLLDLYMDPEKTIESRITYLIALVIGGVAVGFINHWLSKKYPYKSSYKPKDQA